MRKSLVIASLLVLAFSVAAFAGVPDPSRSGCDANGQGSSCQFRFRADAGLDAMSVDVTLRDAFDTPVANCSTTVTLSLAGPSAGSAGAALCFCPADPQAQQSFTTNAAGIGSVTWDALGGRGVLDIFVTAHCQGNIAIAAKTVDFTSPDLDGSCDAGVSTGVIDLGIWAAGLSTPVQASDYDCSGGNAGVIDLGVWAGGLAAGC